MAETFDCFVFIRESEYSFCNLGEKSYSRLYLVNQTFPQILSNPMEYDGFPQAISLFTQRMINILTLYHLLPGLDTFRATQFKENYNQNDSNIVLALFVYLRMQHWSQQDLQ